MPLNCPPPPNSPLPAELAAPLGLAGWRRDLPGRLREEARGVGVTLGRRRLLPGGKFNRKVFGLKSGLSFHFDSETCLNYKCLTFFLAQGISSGNSSGNSNGFSSGSSSGNTFIE